MNIYKRLFCVLLVFVLLFVQFLPLHTVHATENNNIIELHPEDFQISTLNLTEEDFSNNNIQVEMSLYCGSVGKPIIPSGELFLSNTLNYSGDVSLDGFDANNKSFEERITFTPLDNSRLFAKGSKVNFNISNLFNHIEYTDENNDSYRFYLDPSAVHNVGMWCFDINGQATKVLADNFNFKKLSNDRYNLELSIESLPVDTYKIIVFYSYNYQSAYGWSGLTYRANIWRHIGFSNSKILFEETTDDGTKGLLANIIALVNNIKDGIIDLPNKIASSIKGFFDSVVSAVTNVVNAVTNIGTLIKNAIVNLGDFLLDGIKGLFVPSEEDITEMKDRWTDLLRDRFGALYQTVELIDSYGKSFQAQEKNTITMPSIDLALAGAVFTFGGWEVQVVPEGFDVLFNALKLIISIVCTIWFVNGLKNRFEKLVGGADNI